MPKINLILNPGHPQLRELCDKEEGRCVDSSLMFDDDKDASGFTFRDEIVIPANTKVHVAMWCNKNKNQKPYFGINIESFEDAWTKRQEAKKSSPKKEGDSPSDNKLKF